MLELQTPPHTCANKTCLNCKNHQTCPPPYVIELPDDDDKQRALTGGSSQLLLYFSMSHDGYDDDGHDRHDLDNDDNGHYGLDDKHLQRTRQ